MSNDHLGEFKLKIFDHTLNTLEHALDYSTQKNKTIANNIANVDTPNYKSQDVVFKDVLQNELQHQFEAKRTHPKHLPFSLSSQSGYKTVTKHNTLYNHNQNNVDIDKEMANLAKNQIYYRSMVDRMNGKFNTLQTVIRGGR